MPQIQVNSVNIGTFSFDVAFDLYNKKAIFDTSASTYNNISGSGVLFVQGISFLLADQDGVALTEINWTTPQIPTPATEDTFELDLSSFPTEFLFQQFKIVGAIRDQDGQIYTTTPVYKKVCKPKDVTTSGYVPGLFQVSANCVDRVLSVKELTPLAYDGKAPVSVSKSGVLSYPTGTISSISFTGTPFNNDEVYTGEYRVACETLGTYDLGDGVSVIVTYKTNNDFEVNCANKIADIMCCLVDLQQTAIRDCNNAVGKNAQEKLNSVVVPFLVGLTKEINGRDASTEADLIRKTLNCGCGDKSTKRTEFTPINPYTTNIVLSGVGGTSIGAPTINGNTKTFNIASNVYQVVKGNPSDLAFTISTDTATSNTVKYKITFNYDVMASYILTAISSNNTLLTLFNSLVESSNFTIDLSNLNGKCILDISSNNYFLSLRVPSSAATIKNVVINGNTYTAPSPIIVTNEAGIEAWLNGLGLGTFTVGFENGDTGAYINILTTDNSNVPTTATFVISGLDSVVAFQKTNKSLIAFLQALVDYLCGLTTLQVALSNNLSLCSFDYNGSVITQAYPQGTSQTDFNTGVAASICNLAARINTLTSVTCAQIQALFPINPNVVVGNSDTILSVVGGNCTRITNRQVALSVIGAINSFADVKTAFCAISCTTPATCPEITNASLSIIGTDIAFYGVVWGSTPGAAQTATIRYRVNGTQNWITATNNISLLPNGTINGTTPYLILGLTPGTTYDVQVLNNCGGAGFITQVTTPTTGIFANDYRYGNVLYDICAETATTLYSSTAFGTGTTMYTNIGLTTVLTGFTYITNSGGAIYAIDPVTGVVGALTGVSCTAGEEGRYAAGNVLYDICSLSDESFYTNGAFGIGKIIYTDASLTNPLTGFTYIARYDGDTADIYNIDPVTGVVGADTGLNCAP